jgi:hypothetical protein
MMRAELRAGEPEDLLTLGYQATQMPGDVVL